MIYKNAYRYEILVYCSVYGIFVRFQFGEQFWIRRRVGQPSWNVGFDILFSCRTLLRTLPGRDISHIRIRFAHLRPELCPGKSVQMYHVESFTNFKKPPIVHVV